MMSTYRVVWEIDVAAETGSSAAREARRYQLPGTSALVFVVTGDTEGVVEDLIIDLADHGEENNG